MIFPKKKFKVILADPPWSFRTRSDKGEGRSAKQHYNTMSLDDIKKLPVDDIADEDCALFLWVTMPNLLEGIAVLEAWGFEYKTVAFTWVKQNMKSPGYFMGMGYWTRSNTEIVLLGTRGRPKRIAKNVPQLIVSPRREHSRKPDEIHDRIQRLVGGPYIELFGRQKREGWEVWGNQTDKFTFSPAISGGSSFLGQVISGSVDL